MQATMQASRTRTERFRDVAHRHIGVLMDATNTNTAAAAGAEDGTKEAAAATTTIVDGTNEDHISMMIEDLQKGLHGRLDGIKTDMLTCKQDQLQAHYSGMMKIPKSTREMTIAEFNEKYNCNLLDLLKTSRMNTLPSTVGNAEVARKMPPPVCGKRDRLETPAPHRGNRPMQTPATIVRTVRRGEMLFSKNGSPVDPIDEGALVATVTKKRRGNAIEGAAANFDINVGDGRYISLNDPAGVQNLDDDMKTSALSQLKVLQDQMASLMKQLTTTESSKK